MKGNVIGFDPDTNTGAISGYDGNRYDFATVDWHGHDRRPAHGDIVDFAPDGHRATQIYLLEPTEPQYVPPTFGQFYFSTKGRISRSQYWLRYFLPVVVIAFILGAISGAGQQAGEPGLKVLPALFQLLVVWPGIAILVKRIHDRDKSGVLVWALYGPYLVAIVFALAGAAAVAGGDRGAGAGLFVVAGVGIIASLIVGIWFFIEFGCMRGTVGANKYGPDPVPHT